MKKLISLAAALLLLLCSVPVFAKTAPTRAARTERLDLTAVTSPASNTAEGWAYDPAGDDGNPRLTLTNYGLSLIHI